MVDNDPKGLIENTDSVLRAQTRFSLESEFIVAEKRPESFTALKPKIIKSVSLYLQLLWDDCPNGKIIRVIDLISNSQNLFGTKFESKDIYVIRHIASDLREISLFSSNISNGIKKYFKNIDINRADIAKRIILIKKIREYLSEIVHMNYQLSHEKAKAISKDINDLEKENILIPEQFDQYFEIRTFYNIFEDFCIIFIFNFYNIFLEFLYNDKR